MKANETRMAGLYMTDRCVFIMLSQYISCREREVQNNRIEWISDYSI